MKNQAADCADRKDHPNDRRLFLSAQSVDDIDAMPAQAGTQAYSSVCPAARLEPAFAGAARTRLSGAPPVRAGAATVPGHADA
jgi:hypothetical protein